MSEASKQPSTQYPVFGENTLPQPLMKSYSAAFPMRGENFGDRLFASWHSAASFVCGNVKLACCFASSTNRHFLCLGKAVQRLPWQ